MYCMWSASFAQVYIRFSTNNQYEVIFTSNNNARAREFLTKMTEFLDFGATFDLDRIFSFFFRIEGGCQAPTSPKPSFWPLSQKWQSCPKMSYYKFEICFTQIFAYSWDFLRFPEISTRSRHIKIFNTWYSRENFRKSRGNLGYQDNWSQIRSTLRVGC